MNRAYFFQLKTANKKKAIFDNFCIWLHYFFVQPRLIFQQIFAACRSNVTYRDLIQTIEKNHTIFVAKTSDL